MSKTIYEIRLDILELSRTILESNEYNRMRMEEEMARDTTPKPTIAPAKVDAADIIVQAKKFEKFIFSNNEKSSG